TTTLAGANTYTGDTVVNGGTLVVNGSVIGAVFVNAGGTLGGNGQIGPTTVNGTIAPGNSIGTLTVNGAYFQNKGSTYTVEINAAGQSDLIKVNGSAKLNGGIVQVLAAKGTYQNSLIYTILT